MKRFFYIIIAIALSLLSVSSIKAQDDTTGKDFWLTFGRNGSATYSTVGLQIRIVSGDSPTKGTIEFTKLGTSISFNIAAQQVYTYDLTPPQKEAVYNISMGISNRSIHITSDYPVTVYALNQYQKYTDATNIFPVTALGTNYYQISYMPFGSSSDAYAVVAIEDNTKIYHDGSEAATLKAGDVYYRTEENDMTGAHITSTEPIAFFAVNQLVRIPVSGLSGDCFMQQLAPVNTWGKKFLVPVADLTLPPSCLDTKNRVRIVAARSGTTFVTAPTNVTLITDMGGQSPLTKSLNAGEFFEFDIMLNHNGCFFETNKPIGVCTYLPSMEYNNNSFSDPSQAWLPSIEQAISGAMIAPFVPIGNTNLNAHDALIITETATKNNTKVSVGGGTFVSLSGGVWRDHPSGYSFYIMPLTNQTASYFFTNSEGIIVMGYGTGNMESYYYLASSALRNLYAAFTANGIPYLELSDHVFCENQIDFAANVQGIDSSPGSLNWYINSVHQPTLTDRMTWSQSFTIGNYEIIMDVLFEDGSTEMYEGTLKIGADISTSASPLDGGIVTGSGCYEQGETVNVTATPNVSYNFVNWTKNGAVVSQNTDYSFAATENSTLIANFLGKDCEVILLANPPSYGTVSGAGIYPYGDEITVHAIPAATYDFVRWTENGVEVSTNADYSFTIMGNRTLTAHFAIATYDIMLSANPPDGGNVSGGGNYSHGTPITVSAFSNSGYNFVNWTENDVEVSQSANFSFTVTQSRSLVANFEREIYEVIALIDDEIHGFTEGSGLYEANTTAQIQVITTCYRFKCWTIDGVPVSIDNPYRFIVRGNVTLVANFYILDFDTYCPTLWNNTFMLNMKKLREDGYGVTGCQWYKNGVEESDTHTLSEFSYSAGPKKHDLLEPAPTYYSFRLITDNSGELCSTLKYISYPPYTSSGKIWTYPNPALSGIPFTIEGVAKNDEVRVYNQYGNCVYTAIASGETITVALNLQAGMYVVKAEGKQVKVVVVR